MNDEIVIDGENDRGDILSQGFSDAAVDEVFPNVKLTAEGRTIDLGGMTVVEASQEATRRYEDIMNGSGDGLPNVEVNLYREGADNPFFKITINEGGFERIDNPNTGLIVGEGQKMEFVPFMPPAAP